MYARHSFQITMAELLPHYGLHNGLPGWADIPEGYHVTIFPTMNDEQILAAVAGKSLDEIEKAMGAVQFNTFNVTHNDSRKHFYFTETGGVVWQQTNTEASLNDPRWQHAITAALCVYNKIGVVTSSEKLFRQLWVRGRTTYTLYEQQLRRADAEKQAGELEAKLKTNPKGSLKFKPRNVKVATTTVKVGPKMMTKRHYGGNDLYPGAYDKPPQDDPPPEKPEQF